MIGRVQGQTNGAYEELAFLHGAECSWAKDASDWLDNLAFNAVRQIYAMRLGSSITVRTRPAPNVNASFTFTALNDAIQRPLVVGLPSQKTSTVRSGGFVKRDVYA